MPKRRSWFRAAFGGARWVGGVWREWLGVRALSQGATGIGRSFSQVRAGSRRNRRFKVDPAGGFDLQASAFLYGMTRSEFERRLEARQRETALLAYLLLGLALVLLVGWAWSTLSAPVTGSRLLVAFEFLPFCVLLFLMAFYQALLNFQIRVRRTAGWREYLTTDQPFLPR